MTVHNLTWPYMTYMESHDFTWPFMNLYCLTWPCITLHHLTLPYFTLRYRPLCYTALHYTALRYISLRCSTCMHVHTYRHADIQTDRHANYEPDGFPLTSLTHIVLTKDAPHYAQRCSADAVSDGPFLDPKSCSWDPGIAVMGVGAMDEWLSLNGRCSSKSNLAKDW